MAQWNPYDDDLGPAYNRLLQAGLSPEQIKAIDPNDKAAIGRAIGTAQSGGKPAQVAQAASGQPAAAGQQPATDEYKPDFGGFDPFKDNPAYTGYLDPDGSIKDILQLGGRPDIQGLTGNYTSGDPTVGDTNLFNQERDDIQGIRALSQSAGPTRFAQSLLDQQRLEQLQGAEDIDMRSAGANLNLYSQLAQEGGLGGGARERIGRSSERDRLLEQQSLGRAGQTQRLGILSADEQNKLRLMEGLPGMTGALSGRVANRDAINAGNMLAADQFNVGVAETNMARGLGIDQYNIGNTIAGMKDQNLYDQGIFDRRANLFGGFKTAEEITKSGRYI